MISTIAASKRSYSPARKSAAKLSHRKKRLGRVTIASGTKSRSGGAVAKTPVVQTFSVDPLGNVKTDGTVLGPAGAGYAEMFETADRQPIEPGCFVALDGSLVRKATAQDEEVLGVVTAKPMILGDASELHWNRMFLEDEWGRPLTDESGQRILNPEYDPNAVYVPRRQRPEWVSVGLLGKLTVRDDGSCRVNEYCWPNADGIASAAPRGFGFKVMKRIGPAQILILLGGVRVRR